MNKEKKAMCPLFPEMACPQGKEASQECEVRVNGDFDPVLYFRDELVMHCAIYRKEQASLTLTGN